MLLLGAVAFSSCEDSTSTIGSSLVTDDTQIVIDSTFVVSGQSTLSCSADWTPKSSAA